MSMVKVMKIDEWLEKKSIEKDAIIFKDQNWTFSHLIKLITKTSLFLQNECQLKVGDRFCYFGTNNPEQIVLLFAASKIGAIMLLSIITKSKFVILITNGVKTKIPPAGDGTPSKKLSLQDGS